MTVFPYSKTRLKKTHGWNPILLSTYAFAEKPFGNNLSHTVFVFALCLLPPGVPESVETSGESRSEACHTYTHM